MTKFQGHSTSLRSWAKRHDINPKLPDNLLMEMRQEANRRKVPEEEEFIGFLKKLKLEDDFDEQN